ncbi:MAG TPA: hypothetical protein VEQ40_02260, partial [Pyrinomonadaceae bacterium]|nr:hypothetical protein [Pyrinomonadaceae bacterium]
TEREQTEVAQAIYYKAEEVKKMSENKGTGRAMQDEGQTNAEKSPAEKLEGDKLTGSLTPGAEKTEPTEIKEEKSPNTE